MGRASAVFDYGFLLVSIVETYFALTVFCKAESIREFESRLHIRHSASTTKNDTFLKIYLADLSPFSSNIPQSMVVHSLTNGPITYAKQIRNLLFYNLQYVAFDIPKGKEIAGRPITTWPGTNGARRSTIAKRLAVTTLLISSVSILPRFLELNCSQLSQPIHQ